MSPKLSKASSDQRRKLILQATAKCFAEKGFYQTSVDDIVREANISKGALYTYYSSKDELFHLLIEDNIHTMFATLEKEFSKMETCKEKLHYFFQYEQYIGDRDIQLATEYWLYSRYNETARAYSMKRYNMMVNYIGDIIRFGQDQGEFSEDISAYRLSAIIWAFLDGIKLRWLVLKDNNVYSSDLAFIEEYIWTTLLGDNKPHGFDQQMQK